MGGTCVTRVHAGQQNFDEVVVVGETAVAVGHADDVHGADVDFVRAHTARAEPVDERVHEHLATGEVDFREAVVHAEAVFA